MIDRTTRHKNYKHALRDLNIDYRTRKRMKKEITMSICTHLKGTFEEIFQNYPELIRQIPKLNYLGIDVRAALLAGDYSNYWWDPELMRTRRAILYICINDTKP